MKNLKTHLSYLWALGLATTALTMSNSMSSQAINSDSKLSVTKANAIAVSSTSGLSVEQLVVVDNITYGIVDGHAEIIKSDAKDMTEIELPNTVENMTVTVIREGAFSDHTKLQSIKLPDTLTEIGNLAFHSCTSLKDISIPNTVEGIGIQAFNQCTSLVQVDLPDDLLWIRHGTFNGCKSLKEIVIPDSVAIIESGAFSNCIRLKHIKLSNTMIKIGEYTFEGCTSLEEIELPETLAIISERAFGNCTSLTKIKIPKRLLEIGKGAFKGCSSLEEIDIGQSNCEIYDSSDTISNKVENQGTEEICSYSGIMIGSIYSENAKAYAEKYNINYIEYTEASKLGDINNDNYIDAVDATAVLSEYSLLSTGNHIGEFNETQKSLADVNKDGYIDAVDATAILSYYSYVSTGGDMGLEEYIALNK